MGHKRQNKYRDYLFKENPYCPECGVKMVHPFVIERDDKGRQKKYEPDMLTVCHYYSRLDPLMLRKRNRTRITLLCYECRKIKDQEETKALGIEELNRRSSH